MYIHYSAALPAGAWAPGDGRIQGVMFSGLHDVQLLGRRERDICIYVHMCICIYIYIYICIHIYIYIYTHIHVYIYIYICICLHFSICACHPCAGAMLIFSASFNFNGWPPKGIRFVVICCLMSGLGCLRERSAKTGASAKDSVKEEKKAENGQMRVSEGPLPTGCPLGEARVTHTGVCDKKHSSGEEDP